MDSRINTHRPPPNFSFLLSNPLSFSFVHQKVSLKRIRWRTQRVQQVFGRALRSMFQARDADHLFLSLIHLTADTPTYTHTDFYLSLSLLYLRELDAVTIYIPWCLRQVHACLRRKGHRMSAHTFTPVWVLYRYTYVRVTLIALVLVPYRVEQRRWNLTNDRWYNWTSQTILVSFLGLHSWNFFVSTHHPRLYC